jgi:hypothetical protein
MRKSLDQLKEAIEACLEHYEDYETTHDDAGENYMCCIMERGNLYAKDRLRDWVYCQTGWDLESIDFEQLLDDLWFSMRAEPGHIFSSTDNEKHCVLDSALVGELEVQLDPDMFKEISTEKIRPVLLKYLAERDNDFCMRWVTYGKEPNQHHCAYAYINTDAVWQFVVDREDIEEAIENQLNPLAS